MYTSAISNKGANNMNRNIRRNIRRACFDLIGATLIVCVGVILLLSYFDVLTK